MIARFSAGMKLRRRFSLLSICHTKVNYDGGINELTILSEGYF